MPSNSLFCAPHPQPNLLCGHLLGVPYNDTTRPYVGSPAFPESFSNSALSSSFQLFVTPLRKGPILPVCLFHTCHNVTQPHRLQLCSLLPGHCTRSHLFRALKILHHEVLCCLPPVLLFVLLVSIRPDSPPPGLPLPQLVLSGCFSSPEVTFWDSSSLDWRKFRGIGGGLIEDRQT